MTMFDTEYTNIYGDSEVAGRSPDAEGDYYHITDAQADNNYWQEKIADVIGAISDSPTTDFMILYGGVISDSGSSQIDISAGVVRTKDSSGNKRLAYIPAITNLALPSGWNDGRDIWVTARYDAKLGSSTRAHRAGTSYHYQLMDTYMGDANGIASTTTDDMFASADPVATAAILGKFTMTGSTFVNLSAGVRSPEFKTRHLDPIIGSSLRFEADYMDISPSFPWYCLSKADETLSTSNYPVAFIDSLRAKKVTYDQFNTNVSSFSGAWSGSNFTLTDNTANNAMIAELAEEWLFAGSPTSGWRILVSNSVEYNITGFTVGSRIITVSGSPTGTAIEIYLNRILGSTTSAKHFSWAGLGLYMTGQNKITGLRRRDKFQSHRHQGLLYLDSSGGTKLPTQNTGRGEISNTFVADAITDGTNGTPRTGPKTEIESATALVYVYTGGYTV